MNNYQGKNIVIVGLGETGISCVNYFLDKNIFPKVMDKNPQNLPFSSQIQAHFGEFNLEWLLNADLIVLSPGISLLHPAIQAAKNKNIEIIGDVELFCREINAQKNKKIVAITGSNGKTTVTSLVGKIAKTANLNAEVGGNISPPVLTLLKHDLDLYILELSSFQLETTNSLRADIATILNVSADHLDRYPNGFEEYRAAKMRIYHNAKMCLFNFDDKKTFDKKAKNFITFGEHSGDYHLDKNMNLIAKNDIVLNAHELKLIGKHNLLNVLSSLAIADFLQIPRKFSLNAIKNFESLPNRFELIYKNNDIYWINDSKATNIGSTIAALNSVYVKGTLHLLLGGDGKGADFSELKPHLMKNMQIYCFGKDGNLIANLIPTCSSLFENLEQAMIEISKKVKPNDVVLLSPACASLDQFENYIQRGKIFTKLAKSLG